MVHDIHLSLQSRGRIPLVNGADLLDGPPVVPQLQEDKGRYEDGKPTGFPVG